MTAIQAAENLNESERLVGHYINGKSVTVSGERTQAVYNPATGQVVRQVALAGKTTVQQAVAAAAAAYPAWRGTAPLKRARIMFPFQGDTGTTRKRDRQPVDEEHGKVLDDARGEFIRGVRGCRICLWRAGAIERRKQQGRRTRP